MCLLAACIADNDIEATQSLNGLGNELLAKGFVAQISRNGQTFPTGLLDERDDVLGVWFFCWKVVDSDVCTFPGIGDRRSAAHAGVASCNKCLTADQAAGPLVRAFTMIWRGKHLARKTR